MAYKSRMLVVAAAALWVLLPRAVLADVEDTRELEQIPDRDWDARCNITNGIFYRLADLRKGNTERRVAIYKVRRWIEEKGDIGSHVHEDYSRSVDAAADFVYGHPELNALSLAHYGYRSCQFQYLFQAEPLKVDAGRMLLLEATRSCQAQHPGDKHNGALRDCIRDQFVQIEQRVKKAHIEVQG